MKRIRMGLLAVAAVACALVSRPARADDGADWASAYQEWTKRWAETQTNMTIEAGAAAKEKRPSRASQLLQSFYTNFLESLSDSKGHRDWRWEAEMGLQICRLQYPDLGADFDTVEKTMRGIWQKQYKPDRRNGFYWLYHAAIREKRYKDAIRLAEECYKEYEWEWSSREWLAYLITALSYDPESKPRLLTRIDEYAKKHLAELDGWKEVTRHLGYLIQYQEWDRAAAIVRTCLRSYKDCDWEPQFLGHAVTIYTGRASAPAKAATPPAKPPAVAAPPADDNAALALEALKRGILRHPHEPEVANAARAYLQWAIAQSKDNPDAEVVAGRAVASYLKARPNCPLWEEIRVLGLKFAQSQEQEWVSLAARAPDLADEAKARQAELEKLKAVDNVADAEGRNRLRQFIAANPETVEARAATVYLTATLGRMVLRTPWETDIPATAQAIRTAFPDSPAFRSQQLQAIGMLSTEPWASPIMEDLIHGARNPLQKDHGYNQNNLRYTSKLQYSMDAFKVWQKTFPDSYGMAAGFSALCQQANYSGHPEDASRACDWMTNERYLTSIDVARCFALNVYRWLTATMMEDAAKIGGKGAAKGNEKAPTVPNAMRQSYAKKASRYANEVDEAFSDRWNLGFLYYEATPWGKEVRFRGQGSMTGRDVLRTKPYQYSAYYYQAGANRDK